MNEILIKPREKKYINVYDDPILLSIYNKKKK